MSKIGTSECFDRLCQHCKAENEETAITENAPKRIWMDEFEWETDFRHWRDEKLGASDTEYIRADLLGNIPNPSAIPKLIEAARRLDSLAIEIVVNNNNHSRGYLLSEAINDIVSILADLDNKGENNGNK